MEDIKELNVGDTFSINTNVETIIDKDNTSNGGLIVVSTHEGGHE
jgi:hypothetical protein